MRVQISIARSSTAVMPLNEAILSMEVGALVLMCGLLCKLGDLP
jgi:hypothetical protein